MSTSAQDSFGQPDPARPGPSARASRPAAFFDLDKTIIARSSLFAFSRPFLAGGLITRRAVVRNAYAHFLFQVGGADHDQIERTREYLTALVAGWDVQQVRDIVAETLEQQIVPVVYREATELIEHHHRAGRDVVIVSASGSEVVEPIGTLLGADHVIATRIVVDHGVYTGALDFYAYGENKAVAVRELAAQRGYDLSSSFAYSDSVTDLPLLEAVGHPHAVNPDRPLRREAALRGWPVLDFTQPMSLRDRLPRLTPPRRSVKVASGALAGGVVAAALTYLVTRRRVQRSG